MANTSGKSGSKSSSISGNNFGNNSGGGQQILRLPQPIAGLEHYTLLRSNRKTVSLEISDDLRLLVRGPLCFTPRQALAFLEKHQGWLEKHIAEKRRYLAACPEPDSAQIACWKQQAGILLPERVAYFAPLLQVQPSRVRITSARKRFGSCSSRGVICFSWRLMAYPPAAIDYVVVHELAHLRHMNHSAAFYRQVAAILPDWRQRQELLRKAPEPGVF